MNMMKVCERTMSMSSIMFLTVEPNIIYTHSIAS